MLKKNKRILVIDNDPIFCESIKVFLEEREYAVYACQESDKALAVMSEFTPDVILLDLKIGTRSGLEILKTIRSQNKDVKIIIVTGSLDYKKIESAQQLGADEYMIKPFSMSDLIGTIDKL